MNGHNYTEGYGYKWSPSKTQKKEFAQTMNDIDKFCAENNISQSGSSDSYYFTIDGQKYRVSNHTIDASNRGAYNDLGERIRPNYHTAEEKEEEIQIFAGKTRIKQIYNDLKNGYKLDKRGNRIYESLSGKHTHIWRKPIRESKDYRWRDYCEDDFDERPTVYERLVDNELVPQIRKYIDRIGFSNFYIWTAYDSEKSATSDGFFTFWLELYDFDNPNPEFPNYQEENRLAGITEDFCKKHIGSKANQYETYYEVSVAESYDKDNGHNALYISTTFSD